MTRWVCPVSTDCLPLSHGTSSQSNHFVICRAEVPERGVSASGVVETLDVLEDRCPGGLSVRPRVTVDQLSFESGDEALGHRVVVGIRYRSHRREQACLSELAAELHRGVLTTSV